MNESTPVTVTPETTIAEAATSELRRGQRRTTKEEYRQRIRDVMTMLIDGKKRSEIRSELYARHQVGWRTVERYVTTAQRLLKTEAGADHELLRAKSYAWYMAVLQDEDVSTRDKLSARKAADELLGLVMPKKTAQTTAAGADIHEAAAVKDLTDEELEVLRKIRERQLVAANPQGSAN